MTMILFPILLAALLGTPSQQPRDGARPAASGSSRISGVVVTDDRTPQPVRRAIVTIADAAAGVSRSTITDDSGRFAFDTLPAGRFGVTAARRAYLTSAFGAAYPGDAGTKVTLAEGASADDLRITLPKGAVLTGVITDMAGLPVPALAVTVYRETGTRYATAGDDVTDDRGIYRVYGLQPGEYTIGAAPRTTGTGDIGVRSEREVDALLSALERRGSATTVAPRPGETADSATPAAPQRTYSFAQVYYPGTAVAAEAARVTVVAGEVRSGLDFTLGAVPTATIAGTVVGSDGQPARDIQISMVPVGPPVTLLFGSGSTGPARTGQDGSFTRSSVTPGTYRILARRNPPAPALTGRFTSAPSAGSGETTEWAMTEITVNGDDVQGLSLALRPGLRVTGRIVFEGTSEIPSNLSTVRVALTPATATARTVTVAPVAAKADGTVEITNLLPGSYSVGLALPPEIAEGWWPRSASSGGRDLLDLPLELVPGATPDVVFTLTDRRQSLAGVVQDANGRPTTAATIVVFSMDRAHWRHGSRRVRTARPATDGTYEIADIPPGEYFVAAVPQARSDGWQPAFLERLAAAAVPVAIGEGEQKTQDVRLSVR
jgi:Carboxypeptidase regulatory-like domain